MNRSKSLDILEFWKSNQFWSPELSRMARDILSVPVSTVAHEAAFSVGGRVVDDIHSALLPTNIEALICTNDWLFKGKDTLAPSLHELVEDVFNEVDNLSMMMNEQWTRCSIRMNWKNVRTTKEEWNEVQK